MTAVQTVFSAPAASVFGVILRCPLCLADFTGLECPLCGFRFHLHDAIVQALPPDRVAHYARFVRDYEHIRMAEGRGGADEEFYLALPWIDRSGRNIQQWQIRARSFRYLTTHILAATPSEDQSPILDIGAGNCWMSYRLALAGYRPVAVDLLINRRDGLGAADHYRKVLPTLFPRYQAEMERLPFPDGQFDSAIFNASFHYCENAEVTLREALRCVRKGGRVIIVDTPWYSTDASGRQMLVERRAGFIRRHGTASDSIKHLEYLTDARLQNLKEALSIRWEVHVPRYGFRWAMRPVIARLRRRREPSQFRIHVARKPS
jgi:SAM-dependent methyltransferase